jgi:hypothetical protein
MYAVFNSAKAFDLLIGERWLPPIGAPSKVISGGVDAVRNLDPRQQMGHDGAKNCEVGG